jgi:hypothetical protein
MGLPLSLHDDDVDVCYPTAERHPSNQHPPGELHVPCIRAALTYWQTTDYD